MNRKKTPDMLLLSLESLPLHKAAYDGAELTEEMIRQNLHTAYLQDYDGKSVIDIVLEKRDKCHVTIENLFVLIEVSLSTIDSSSFEDSQQSEVWVKLVQMDDYRSIEVVRLVIEKYKPHLHLLAQGKDKHGRSYVDLASSESKELIKRKLFLNEQYDLHPASEHRSPTSYVWLAKYHAITEKSKASTANSNSDLKVALKFMKRRNHFFSEINSRREGNLDNQYVVGIKDSYDGDLNDLKNGAFRSDAVSKGFVEYPYCIVMEGADQNLANMMLNGNISGTDKYQIKVIIKHVLSALVHMHERGIVHSDVKPLNIVVCGDRYKLIDLDAAANMNRGDYVGTKYSSLYSPPEMFWENEGGVIGVRSFTRDAHSNEIAGVYPYTLVKAAASHDMWSVGVLFYELTTGSSLVLSNRQDHIVDQRDIRRIYTWETEMKFQVICNLGEQLEYSLMGYGERELIASMNFLSMLLYKDPNKRLSAIEALDHPSLSGKNFVRLSWEEAQFDVFLSYRSDIDTTVPEKLFQSLIDSGLRVSRTSQNGLTNIEGLRKSAIVVSFLSRGSVNIADLDSYTLSTNTTGTHNVLVEWLLTLELSGRGLIDGLYPVLIGDNDGSGIYGNYFEDGCNPTDMSHVAEMDILSVYSGFRRQLEEHGLGFPFRTQDNSTVTAIFKDLMVKEGFLFEGGCEDAVKELSGNILGMLGKSNQL